MKALTLIFVFINLLFASDNISNSNFKKSKIQTYKANFTQTVTNPSNKIIEYTGKIYIKQPKKMLWQYKDPIIKDVYMNNTIVIINEPELEQAIFTNLTDEINLIELLNNPDKINDKYKLTFKNRQLLQIQYQDEMENNIKISFTKIKLNEKISDQIFQFVSPLGYDIIRK